MKAKFTYKEFTLIAGVVVALIIMITLWINPVFGETGGVTRKSIPAMSKPAAKVVIEKVASVIIDSIH